MNLIEEQVAHHTFGIGRVLTAENGRITVQFVESIGQKVFQYPSAFEKHLKMCNPLTQDFVQKELKKMLEELAAEQTLMEQQRLEAASRLAAEQAVLLKPAAKKSKKAATKKVKKTDENLSQ